MFHNSFVSISFKLKPFGLKRDKLKISLFYQTMWMNCNDSSREVGGQRKKKKERMRERERKRERELLVLAEAKKLKEKAVRIREVERDLFP